MKVVVGLGNPGPRYRGTRHNVGFAVVDYLALGPGTSSPRSRFQAQVVEFQEAGVQLLLVKPETFMNLSGRCVREIVDFYKLPLEDLLIVCDDINLPLGKLRARAKGSAGGHNGLRNIQDQLSTADYARLRIGVDAPMLKHDDATVDHVLSRFRPGEQDVIDEAVQKSGQAVLLWAREGIELCMTRVNGPEAKEKKPPKKGDEKDISRAPKTSEKIASEKKDQETGSC
jgi:PTH1 family peptidyl-tRNA hydrolase